MNSFPSSNRFLNRLKQWLYRLNISGKISFGYALTLGIALTGTMAGIAIGETYQQHSRNLINDALQETSLLHKLQTDLLKSKSMEKKLADSVDKPELFRQRYALYQERTSQLEQSWREFRSSYANSKVEESAQEQKAFEKLRQDYDGFVTTYFQQTKVIFQQTEPSHLTPAEIEAIHAKLVDLDSSPLALRLTEFVEDIDKAVAIINEEVKEAEEALDTFARIRLQIIIFSMLISVVLAVIITLCTSQALTRPLQSVTKVAQQATQESNFELQAPVTTTDEIGIVATVLNQLIQKVRQLLQEQEKAQEQLELYNHTLEQKVKERTEELNQKNLYLQQTLQELKRTQIQMIQSEKLSSLGQLVAGVAHEINNPVSFIYGNLTHASEYTQNLLALVELYQKYYPQPAAAIQKQIEKMELEFVREDLPQTIDSMKMGAERIREIIISLRNFSRLDHAEIKKVNIHEGIDSTLMILRSRLKADGKHPEIKVIKEYGQLPLITCYPGQLNQVFMNILSNAIDAIEEYNQKRTKEEIKKHPSQIKIRTQVIDDNWVAIRIADNGSGISENISSNLFDPFFTTKPVGKGTGLGLSISYQIIVEKHGGRIVCNSASGIGTEFLIEIPICQ